MLTAKVNKDNTSDLLKQLQAEMAALEAKGGGDPRSKAAIEAQRAAMQELGQDWESKLEATKDLEKTRKEIMEDKGLSLSEMQQAATHAPPPPGPLHRAHRHTEHRRRR